MNILIQIFYAPTPLEYIPKSKTVRSHSKCRFNFIKNCQTVVQSGVIVYIVTINI